MTYVVVLGVRDRKRSLRAGHLFCPRCYRRTPGEMFLVERRAYLFNLLPVWTLSESPNFLGCGRCGGAFEEKGDWAFDFGDHPVPRVWDCRHCGEQNTSERCRCGRCARPV